MRDLAEQIRAYEAQHKNIKIAYGGDGTVLDTVQTSPTKCIFPFRNYGLCKKHEHRLEDFLNGKDGQKECKLTLCPYIEFELFQQNNTIKTGKGIAEVVIKSKDIILAQIMESEEDI